MAVTTLAPGASRVLAARWTADAPLVVIALCAAWCTTCGEFRATFERLAASTAAALYIWLDIEDDADVCGDIEVENFPTLAIFRGDALLHYGVTLPAEGSVARLIAEMATRTTSAASVPDAVRRLPQALRAPRG